MAHYDQLPSSKQNEYHDALLKKVTAEHDSAYQAKVAKAKTKRQIENCAGQYEGSWFRLLNSWLEGNVPNLLVIDCLSADFVIGDVEGVKFTACGRIKSR